MPSLPVKPWWRADRNAWYVTYLGKQRMLAKGKNSKAEANRALARLLSERRPKVKADCLSLRAALDLWLERSAKVSASETYRRHLWTANSFASFVGDGTPLVSVTENHVAAWSESKGWQRGTKVQNLNTIRSALSYCVRQGFIDTNPCVGLSYGSAPARIAMMDDEQTRRVLAATESGRWQSLGELIRVMHATGMRPSEAMRLQAGWMAADFSKAHVKVHKTSAKTTRPRVVHFPQSIRPLIQQLCERHTSGPILRNSKGQPWTHGNADARMRAVRASLGYGVECCLESFRHQWITDALERGVPIATVAELCGNSVAVISRHYSKLAQRTDYLADAVDSVR